MLLKAFACLAFASSSLAQLESWQVAYEEVLQTNRFTGHHVANLTAMHLSSLAAGESFTTLSHPRFPAHQVRVKKTDFCDPTVKYVHRTSYEFSC
jgi:hypothetical protein